MEKLNYKKCLDGEWRLFIAEHSECKNNVQNLSSGAALKNSGYLEIAGSVPGNFELDMQKAGLIGDPFYDVDVIEMQKLENRHLWYVCEFDFSEDSTDGFYLHFDGVDTYAEYYLNGEFIGETDNMLISHELPLGNSDCSALKKGKNELLVHITPAMIAARDKTNGQGSFSVYSNSGALNTRKASHMYGWDIMPRIVSGGIWRSVYLCKNKAEYIDEVYLYQRGQNDPREQHLYYKVNVEGDFIREYALNVVAVCGDHKFEYTHWLWHTEGTFNNYAYDAKLWWPRNMGEQNLYNVTVTLLHGDEVLDTKTFRHGIRCVKLLKSDYIDDNGESEFCFTVNGERFFAMGTNWVPLDAFHSRDKERLPKALELLLDSGCNMIRCWGGNVYGDTELYDFCDEHGIAVWQDFAMACAYYPQNKNFLSEIEKEAESVVKKYRQHASLFLWAGDNEGDLMFREIHDPNDNIITREVLPRAIKKHDMFREYLPSSPYISQKSYDTGHIMSLPEDHLWGPRQYYKQEFYRDAKCRFVSETGYHGCNSPESVKKFIAPSKLWPWKDNKSWLAHAVCMELESRRPDGFLESAYRIALMASHLDVLFGDTVPDGLESFALASQISQAEACKYFIERFRSGKGLRTGIIWWNLLDGWPQFSDAVVDYYYCRKLAYFVIKRCQTPLCLMFRDPASIEGKLELCAVNESMQPKSVSYTVKNVETDEILVYGFTTIGGNSQHIIECFDNIKEQTMLLIEYTVDGVSYKNHYLTGEPTYNFEKVVGWYKKAEILDIEGF